MGDVPTQQVDPPAAGTGGLTMANGTTMPTPCGASVPTSGGRGCETTSRLFNDPSGGIVIWFRAGTVPCTSKAFEKCWTCWASACHNCLALFKHGASWGPNNCEVCAATMVGPIGQRYEPRYDPAQGSTTTSTPSQDSNISSIYEGNIDSPFFPPSSSGLDSEGGDAEEPGEGAKDENQDQVPGGGPRRQHGPGFNGDTPGTSKGRYDDILSNQVADGALFQAIDALDFDQDCRFDGIPSVRPESAQGNVLSDSDATTCARDGDEVEILLEREGGSNNPNLGEERETGEPSSSSDATPETPGEPEKVGQSSGSKVLDGPEPDKLRGRRTISAGGASFITGRQSRTKDWVTRSDKEVRGAAKGVEPRDPGNGEADNYGDTRTGSEVSRPETIDLATSEADSTETSAEHSGYQANLDNGQSGKQKQEGAGRGNLRRARSGRKMGRPACKFFTRGNCRVDNCRFEHVRYRQDNYLEQKEKILRQSLKKKKEDLEKLKEGTETDQSNGSSGSQRNPGGEPKPKRHRKSSSPPRRRNDARRK